MAVTFSIERFETYLFVVVNGSIRSAEDIIGYWTPVREECEKFGLRRILVDYRDVELALDYFGMIQVSKYAQERQFHFLHFKIAYLAQPKDMQAMLDYKTPARNRGFDFHPFTDRDSAMEWLLAQ